MLETKRLVLRAWRDSDAESLYEYAKDPRVGPLAGWPVHTSVKDSREIIRDVLSADETYAVVLKGVEGEEGDRAIGSVGLYLGARSDLGIAADEAEVGYWLGVPFWGRGLIPEATEELLRHAFEDLGLSAIWCGYFDKNENSKRVSEKCGFRFQHTEKNKQFSLIGAVKTQHVTRITKDEWVARA
ncbi:MAG TPA: RimJ/RimL family protein N-acetyltransferase [Coriobacteriia bacterium]|nr:RimJ/RimL family protein N-acetyltransferase [Coriobacteriia bacterium]